MNISRRFVGHNHPAATLLSSSKLSYSSSSVDCQFYNSTMQQKGKSIHSFSTSLINSDCHRPLSFNNKNSNVSIQQERNGYDQMIIVRWKTKASKKESHHSGEASDKKNKKKDKHGGGKVESKSSKNESSKDDTNNVADDDEDDHDDTEEVHDETKLPDPKVIKEQMMKHVTAYENYLKSVRNGVPGPEFFDNILVNAYDDPATPILSVAQIVLVSTTKATATCFDPALTNNVVIAIRDKLQLNPIANDVDGIIDIPIPRISMEERVEITTTLKKRTESYRNRIRKVRRKALDIVKNGVAGKIEHVSKDDAYRVQKEIESLSDSIILKINALADKKQNDIMTV
jgi:ribosome recycling factor